FFLESIQKANRVIQNAKDLDQMMRDILNLVLEVLKCDRAWLAYPCNPQAKTWTIPMERTVPEWPGFGLKTDQEVPMNPGVQMIFKQLLDSKGPVIYGKKDWETAIPESIKKYGAKSQIALAIYPKIGGAWAFGIHQCSHERTWTKQEIDIFGEISFLINGALNNLLLVKKLQESESDLKEKITELERVNKLMIGRELRMIELKKELEERLNNSEKLNKQT
ncbi:GAF domain-containing protein, partial [Patescibacteria group bacterium]